MSDKPQKMFNVRPDIKEGQNLLIQRNQAYELDEVGLRMWELCDGNHTIETIAQALCQEYDIDYDQVLIDCQEFVADLTAKGLLQGVTR